MESQTHAQKTIIWTVAILILLGSVVGFWYVRSMRGGANHQPGVVNPPDTTTPGACTLEAKICPDGSAVGRTGPNCEFAPCPAVDATRATVTATLGGLTAGLGLNMSPTEIISDSRCPQGVQCVWAGTVELQATVIAPSGTSTQVFKLGEPVTVNGYVITLSEVAPAKNPGENISLSAYRFTFDIVKK